MHIRELPGGRVHLIRTVRDLSRPGRWRQECIQRLAPGFTEDDVEWERLRADEAQQLRDMLAERRRVAQDYEQARVAAAACEGIDLIIEWLERYTADPVNAPGYYPWNARDIAIRLEKELPARILRLRRALARAARARKASPGKIARQVRSL